MTLTRVDFLQQLQTAVRQRVPIVGAGAGTGLVAKSAALGGADFIAVYCTSRARHRGLPTSIIGDPNRITLELLEEIRAVVTETPIVAGIQATDPTRDMDALLEVYRELGCSGVINYPSMGLYGREYIGGPCTYEQGLEVERAVMGLATEAGLVAMTYVYRPSEAEWFAPVCDVIVAHAGWTVGGLVGAPEGFTHDQAAQAINEQVAAARARQADVIVLGHGGPFSRPMDTEALYALTDVAGFVGASSIERIPVEQAVSGVVREFKAIAMRSSASARGGEES